MIQFENVTKTYGKQTVLKDLNFTIEDGQFVVLIGKSGCGKTTTLKTINQLIPTERGRILIDGEDVSKKDKTKVLTSLLRLLKILLRVKRKLIQI